MTLAFIATGDIALPTFRHLIATGRKPAVLITQPDKPIGRSQSTAVPPAIKILAISHNIPVWQPEKISEIADDLADLHLDIAIVMAYGQIIGKAVRKAPKKAIINLHASLLPKYRGASCIQSAILNGDSETGITVMHVIRELDAGDIICSKTIPILPHETAGELHDRLADISPAAIDEALEILSINPKSGTPQDSTLVSHAPKLLRDHGHLDLNQPAEFIERTIRAYHPWPGTFTTIPIKGKTKRIKIFPPTQATNIPIPHSQLSFQNNQLLLGCANNTSLSLTQLQPEGSKIMPAQAFANQLR